jgi:TolA-binding protein
MTKMVTLLFKRPLVAQEKKKIDAQQDARLTAIEERLSKMDEKMDRLISIESLLEQLLKVKS